VEAIDEQSDSCNDRHHACVQRSRLRKHTAQSVISAADALFAVEHSSADTTVRLPNIKALRQAFIDKLAAARTAAKAEYARISAGKSAAQIDQRLSARSALPADVKRAVDSNGGPARVMSQLDRLADAFAEEVLSGTSRHAAGLAERLLAALIPPAHARLLRDRCSLVFYTLSVGSATDSNYQWCRNVK
jgi:hypothetical protein